MRQGSDAALDAQDATSGPAVSTKPAQTAQAPAQAEVPMPLGSWAARQTMLLLPSKPTGFPAQTTKVSMRHHKHVPPHTYLFLDVRSACRLGTSGVLCCVILRVSDLDATDLQSNPGISTDARLSLICE